MKLKVIVTVGISCSGKTTFAKSLVEQGTWVDVNRDWVRFNVIQPGSDWGSYKFTKAKENKVTEIQRQMISDAWFNGKNVIISDTNLSPKTRHQWIDDLEEFGFDVEVKVFDITLEEAWKRDQLRENGVGRNVIYSQYQKFLEFKDAHKYIPDETKPKAVVVDVDGTIADMTGMRGPFEWDKVGLDKPRQFVIDMVNGLANQGYAIIVVSGRDGSCFKDTYCWIREHVCFPDALIMREQGDTRKDTIVKEEIFWNCIEPHWNVIGVIDDRPSVVRKWYEIGIPNVIAVADQNIEF